MPEKPTAPIKPVDSIAGTELEAYIREELARPHFKLDYWSIRGFLSALRDHGAKEANIGAAVELMNEINAVGGKQKFDVGQIKNLFSKKS